VNDFVQVCQRDEQPIQDVHPLFGFVQLVERAPGDYHLAVFQIMEEGALERKRARLSVYQSQQLHAESGLERCEFVQLVEHFFRLGSALQLNHDAQTPPVRFVAHV